MGMMGMRFVAKRQNASFM